MTDLQKRKINILRNNGLGYKKIAAELGVSENTVKSYCRKYQPEKGGGDVCQYCGIPIKQTPHRKTKRFCSDKCRNAWWSAHPEMRKIPKQYTHRCAYCGAEFGSDRPVSRYCSLACSGKAKRREVSV